MNSDVPWNINQSRLVQNVLVNLVIIGKYLGTYIQIHYATNLT